MEGTIAPEQIIINGQEYTPEDATQLVELGNKYKEMESKLNTSLDKVYPEYTRATQQLKEKEKLLAERDAELERFKQLQEQTKREQTPDEVKKARQAARELGLADEDYLKEKGYMTKEEAEKLYDQKQLTFQQGQQLLTKLNDLEKQIDGSDGRVPFNKEAVIAYQSIFKIDDPMEAYEKINERANAKWKQAELDREERPGLTTLRPGGKKNPPVTKITDDNLGSALSEWLNGISE